MNKELFVSTTPHETKVGITEDDQLAEIYLERENEYTLAGSIYKGRVTRVLPGMQSAFVDPGLDRDAFLFVTDCKEEQEDSSDFERIPANGRPEEGQAREPPQARENREPRQPRAATGVEEEAPRRNGVPAGSGGAASGQGPAGEFEDGTRRWRGRRGRRKGFRPPQGGGQQGAHDQAPQASQTGRFENPRPVETA